MSAQGTTLAMVLLLTAVWLPVGADDTPEPSTETEKPQWYDRITFSGDARFRYEGFKQDDSFDEDRRDRFRIRLRAGLTAAITEKMTFGLQLRNGNPDDPVSNNTSFDGAFQFKEFNLAQGYLDYRFADSFGVIGGKFAADKRWKVSDMQWDDDVTVEGLMENVSLGGGKGQFEGVDIALYQFILEEQKTDNDSYLFGGQARAGFGIGEDSSITAGAGFDTWIEPQSIVDLTLSGELDGNQVTNIIDKDGLLASDFEILNLMAEYRYTASDRWPLKVILFHYRNLGADGPGEDQDTAWFGRLQVGDYKEPWQVALRYAWYYSEPDALFYVFTQSDTTRGSDVEAHRFDVRIGCIAHSYFNITFYSSNTADGRDEDLYSWQCDFIVRF